MSTEQSLLRDLTAQSRSVVQVLLAWAKEDRGSAVADCSRDLTLFRDARVLHATYTRDDTISMLDAVTASARAAVTQCHEQLTLSVCELVRAVLAEADKQRVVLELEPLAALNARRSLTPAQLASQKLLVSSGGGSGGGPSGGGGGARLPALAPLDSAADTARQLQQANELVRKLRERLHAVEDQYSKVMDEKSRLTGANMYLGDQLASEEQRAAASAAAAALTRGAAAAAAAPVAAAPAPQPAATGAGADATALRRELDSLRESHARDVAALQKQVAALQKEQQGKLAESTQFQAMRKMLRDKTALVAKLRELLKPHNPAAAAAGDDDIAADDDD
jgi:hypothetical protein